MTPAAVAEFRRNHWTPSPGSFVTRASAIFSLTDAFSRKVENLAAAVSIHFMYFNFARPHLSLASPYPRTPAMAAGVTDHVWKIEEIVALLDG